MIHASLQRTAPLRGRDCYDVAPWGSGVMGARGQRG